MTTRDDAPTRLDGSNTVDDLAGRLLAELEGERAKTRTAALRRALAAEGGADPRLDTNGDRPSPAARREHLESAVASLAAYTDALEATLDDRNAASAGGRADLDRIEKELATLRETVAELEAADDGVESRVDEFVDRVDHLDERIESRIAVLGGRLERRTGDLEDRIDELDHRADDLDRRIDDTMTVVEERAATVNDGLRALEGRIVDLEENAEAAAEWRESLQSMLR